MANNPLVVPQLVQIASKDEFTYEAFKKVIEHVNQQNTEIAALKAQVAKLQGSA